MTQKLINVGIADKGNGDKLRDAFIKINDNFTDLYSVDSATQYYLGDEEIFISLDPEAGEIIIQSKYDSGMPIYIKGANCTDGGVGGNVVIEAGGPPLGDLITGTVGNVEIAAQQTTIESNNNIWTFRDDGVLELPAGGDIVDSNGDTVLGGTSGISISDFGEGFSLDNADKIVTNKLYSTNLTQPTQHYRLELDTNGVVVLPDGSIINGSTIRGIAGTGELNYTGITIGPNSNDAEKTWVWVDHANAYVSTNNAAHTWTFGTDGTLTLPDSATVAVGDISVLQGLELAYDNSREQLNMAFAADSYEGDGWPAGPNSYNALLLSTDPAIRPEWIPLAQSVRTAWLALGSALEPIYLDIQVAGYTWNFSNAGDLSVPGNKAIKGFDNLQLNVDGGGGKTAVVEIDGYNSKVLIKTTTPGAGIPDDAWTFGDAGELTLPVGGVIQTLTTPEVGTRLTDIPGWIRADINAKTAGFWMDTTPQSLKDAMDATGLVGWQFNPDGSEDFYTVLAAAYVEDNTILELTFDDNLPLESAPYSVTSPNYSARLSSSITIIANENEWIFGTDGILTFPDATVQSTAWTGSVAVIDGGDATTWATP